MSLNRTEQSMNHAAAEVLWREMPRDKMARTYGLAQAIRDAKRPRRRSAEQRRIDQHEHKVGLRKIRDAMVRQPGELATAQVMNGHAPRKVGRSKYQPNACRRAGKR